MFKGEKKACIENVKKQGDILRTPSLSLPYWDYLDLPLINKCKNTEIIICQQFHESSLQGVVKTSLVKQSQIMK